MRVFTGNVLQVDSHNISLLVFRANRWLCFFNFTVQNVSITDILSSSGKTSESQTDFPYYFRGCGWKKKVMRWDSNDIFWIRLMDKLMTMMFGGDFFKYDYDDKKTCFVVDESMPTFVYNREEWASEYAHIGTSDDMSTSMNEDGKL